MSAELLSLTIHELSPLLQNKEISPVELTKAHLEAIESENAQTHLFITVCHDLAMQQAKQAEKELQQGVWRGPLHGIPYSCKDLYHVKDYLTTGGSKVLADNVSTKDALVVQRLRDAGAIVLGKNNLHEFAYGATGENPHYGTVANPYDAKRNAGGSSSGSAASVAKNMSVFSLGTDTGGSVRAPSSLCGVVGLKPTFDKVSLKGVVPYCWSLDHFGVSSRAVQDAQWVFDAVLGQKLGQSQEGSLKGMRVGIPEHFFYEHMQADIRARVEQVIAALKDAGCVCEVVKPPNLTHSRTVSLILQLPEVLSYHSRYFKDKRHLYGDDIMAGMAVGQCMLSEHYVRAKRIAQMYREQLTETFADFDVLLTPATPITAPLLEESHITTEGFTEAKGNAITRYVSFFNITGNPAMSVPVGKDSQGLPMGVQLIAKHHQEEKLFLFGKHIEKLSW